MWVGRCPVSISPGGQFPREFGGYINTAGLTSGVDHRCRSPEQLFVIAVNCAVLQSQKAVSYGFRSEKIPRFGFARQLLFPFLTVLWCQAGVLCSQCIRQPYSNTGVQSQKAVSAHSASEQIPPFGFAEHNNSLAVGLRWWQRWVCVRVGC